MNQTPDIWSISSKVICSQYPSWTPQQSVFSSGPFVSALLGNASRAPCLEAAAWGGLPQGYSLLTCRSWRSPKQVTTHRTCDVVPRKSKTVPFKISVSLQRNKTPPSILLWAALTSSWHLYPCCRRLQNKHVIAALASTALGLVFISREAFACSMHRCTCPAISLSFSALVTAATA